MAKKSTIVTNDFVAGIGKEFLDVDPVMFVENRLKIKGDDFRLLNCGREYLHEIYRYIAFEATSKQGKALVVVKGRQVEFTTTACALSLYLMSSGSYEHLTGLHAFPQIEQARRYSNKSFDDMINESKEGFLMSRKARVSDKSKAFSVTQKDFYGTNTLYIEGTSDSGDRLRGMQLDFIFFDEVQDLAREAREAVQEALSKSKLGPSMQGMQVMFGTPKQANSDFHHIWRNSDQRHFHLKCIHCEHLFPVFYEYSSPPVRTNLEKGEMVRCLDKSGAGCGRLQNKQLATREGEWVPTKVDALYRGYHISQLLIPGITREAIDGKLNSKSKRIFANEVMGQFYSGLTEALTFPQVVDFTTRKPRTTDWEVIPFVKDKFTFMGIDWGGRISGEDDEGKGGYTVVTIISQTDDDKFRLEYAHRMTTGHVDEQLDEIDDLIKRYHVQEVCADFGYGHVQIQRLQDRWGEKVKALFSSQNMKKQFVYDHEKLMITMDKSQVVEQFFEDLKAYKWCFPFKEPEKVEWLCEQIANIEVSSRVVSGMVKKRFDKASASKPVDGAMALVYAYVAFMFRKTRGFTQSQSERNGYGKRNMPRAVHPRSR